MGIHPQPGYIAGNEYAEISYVSQLKSSTSSASAGLFEAKKAVNHEMRDKTKDISSV